MEVLDLPVAEYQSPVRTEAFESLYLRCFPNVAKFVSKMNGSFEDAKDVFHDALVIYHERITKEKLNIEVSEEAYVLGIAKHLWLRKRKGDQQKVSLSYMEASIAIPEDYEEPSLDKIFAFLEKFGKSCLELLNAFYSERRSLSEIAGRFGYRNEHSVSVQKYKCLEKVRNTIKEKSIGYDQFTEGN